MFRSKNIKENSCGMWPCKYSQKWCIVIQNGGQNEFVVIMHVMVPIAMGYKENKSCCDGKKRGVAKICSGKPAINGYQKIFHTPDDRRPTAIDIYIYIYIYIIFI